MVLTRQTRKMNCKQSMNYMKKIFNTRNINTAKNLMKHIVKKYSNKSRKSVKNNNGKQLEEMLGAWKSMQTLSKTGRDTLLAQLNDPLHYSACIPQIMQTRKKSHELCEARIKVGRGLLNIKTRNAALNHIKTAPHMTPVNIEAGLDNWAYIQTIPENKRLQVFNNLKKSMMIGCMKKFAYMNNSK